jgi:ComF family protein
MYKMIDRTLDFFYPKRCPVCDEVINAFELRGGRIKRGPLIHRECHKKIKYIRGATCLKCGKPMGRDSDAEYCDDCKRRRHYFERGFSVFSYRSIAGSIYRFKYMGRQEYARFYGAATRRALGKRLSGLGIDAIVPVPMYRDKERKRGYNQARIYAREVSRQLGIPMYPEVIRRVKNTVPMKELDATGRRNNLKKAFNIEENDVKFKCVLVIDDIYTTGSTIDEIAHEFLMAGVKRVYFLTLAIGQTT